MKVRTLLLLLVLAAVSGFAVLNWNVFTAPTLLSLGITNVRAPLGVVMLGLLVTLTAVFLVFVVYLEASVLFDARHHARELRTNRELADQAESSRFTDLRAVLENGLKRQEYLDAESRAVVVARLERLDVDLRAALEQSEASVSAGIGELEDRFEQAIARDRTASPS